jgi:hypothetical protein
MKFTQTFAIIQAASERSLGSSGGICGSDDNLRAPIADRVSRFTYVPTPPTQVPSRGGTCDRRVTLDYLLYNKCVTLRAAFCVTDV